MQYNIAGVRKTTNPMLLEIDPEKNVGRGLYCRKPAGKRALLGILLRRAGSADSWR